MTTSIDKTILDVLERHSQERPDRVAFRFLGSGDSETAHLTFGELVGRARTLAAFLGASERSQSRVLLLLDAGLPFIEALFACMFARLIPIPVGFPKANRPMDRLSTIIRDSAAQAFITSKKEIGRIGNLTASLPAMGSLRCHVMDAEEAGAVSARLLFDIDPDSPAFVQYTSGSTNAPKGVVITHRNLICNQQQIRTAFQHDDSTKFVGWLPLFHDMGLVGNVLHSAFLGIECTLMPPAAFIQRPSRWLRAISIYGATTSGGPNFAFDHCVNRIAECDIDTFDLSSWRVAFNGAEPVRARTIRAFAEKFARCGFSATSFLPCYGLAEATLFVSGRSRYHECPPKTLQVLRSRLEQGAIEPAGLAAPLDCIELVSSGPPAEGQSVIVIDSESGRQCNEGQIGEIWLAGSNIATSFLGVENASESDGKAVFRTGRGGFVATGDLGVLWNGELFIVGRIKNLIIVRGRNIYAEDVEQVVSCSHDLLQPNRCAVFAIDPSNDSEEAAERIVIVQEVSRRPRDVDELRDAISRARAVTIGYADVSPHDVVLVRPGTIPTTSSGKIRHSDTRVAYLQGRITAISPYE